MNIPTHIAPLIMLGWSIYYILKRTDFKNLKTTWKNLLKAIVLMFFAIIIDRNFYSAEANEDTVEIFFAIPVIIITIIAIRKIQKTRKK